MRLIIAGSRNIDSKSTVKEAIQESQYTINEIDTILCGMADGVDSISREIFEDIDTITIEEYPAEDYLNKAPNPSVAPLFRNTAMAENATDLLAIWDGQSNGTQDMIQKAKQENLSVYIHRTDTSKLTDF